MSKVRNSKLAYSAYIASCIPFIASLFYFVLFKDSSFAQATYAGTKIFTLSWPALIYIFVLKKDFPKFSLKSNHNEYILEGIFSGLAVAILTVVLANTLFSEMLKDATPHINSKVNALGIKENFILFAAFISIVHSLIEEYYWRWFVYGAFRKISSNSYLPHLLAALAFTAHHIIVVSQYFSFGLAALLSLAVFIGGLLWSWMYSRHKSLLAAWISHAIVDIGVMYVGYQIINS